MRGPRCVVPLVVQLRGVPDDDRLAEASDAIARAVAGRLNQANRVIAAREGWNSWNKNYAGTMFRFSGISLDDDQKRRVTAAIEAGVASAIAGGIAARTAQSPFLLAQYSPPAKAPTLPAKAAPAGDGIRIARGGDKVFWATIRSLLFASTLNNQGITDRNDAISTLLQGIRRAEAQALLREALDRPAITSGVRSTVILRLGELGHDRAIAWRLLLYGLERPGDSLGYGPFNHLLDAGSSDLIDFLEATLGAKDEPYRANAARVIRHYLEGQFDPKHAGRRRTYDRLRQISARFGLVTSGPLGADSVRERIAHLIELLLVTVANVSYPLTPAVARETSATNDEHTLDGFVPELKRIAASLPNLTAAELEALDRRILSTAAMVSVLPDRILDIQRSIRGIAERLPNDQVPSDEIVVLQQLRRRFLQALRYAPTDDDAIEKFNAAESDFADLRPAVADVKFARLSRDFDRLRGQVGTADSLRRSDETDPKLYAMSKLLKGYTRSFVDLFSSHGVAGSATPITIAATAGTYEATVQIETDLALYSLLGSMFLLYSAALRYERDIYGGEGQSTIGWESWRAGISERLFKVRKRVSDFWDAENFEGYLAAINSLQSDLEGVRTDIGSQIKRDEEIRTAILLAATLAAGVAGALVRTALLATLFEASAGGARLAVAVTLTEATVFTATQGVLEHVAFGTPVSPSSAIKSLLVNVGQFAAFGAVSRVLGPAAAGGRGWLAFIGRHAAGITLQVDIAALSIALQGRGFPQNTIQFLTETLGAYVIGAATSHIGRNTTNRFIQAHMAEFEALKVDILRRAVEASRTGEWDAATFRRTQQEVLDYWARIERANNFLRDAGLMSLSEHAEAQQFIDAAKTRVSNARFAGGASYQGQLLLDAAQVPGLVRVGGTAIYRYDPEHPPPQLSEIVRSYRRIGTLNTSYEHGTLSVREIGSGRLILLLGPGPVPAGLLAPPTPGAIPPRPWTFLESAAGTQFTPAGQIAETALIDKINPAAIRTLEARGDVGMAALSLLYKYRISLERWSLPAVRGLATALELPRAITRFNLERFFARPSGEVAQLMEDFGAIADMPGANLVFRQNATQRTRVLVDIYRDLLASNFTLPAAMNESAQRGLMQMQANLGREVMVALIRGTPVDRRLALFVGYDTLATPAATLPIAQQILDRNAGDLRPGINLADTTRSPAVVRAAIEAYAHSKGGSFDTHIGRRMEGAIARFRTSLRNVQEGIETDGRNVDSIREEFKAMLLTVERGDLILSFGSPAGAAAQDTIQAVINVGWRALRGRITVINAPPALPTQIDVLSTGLAGIDIQEVAFSHLALPDPLLALATSTGPVTVDWSQLGDSSTHRKWQQIFKYMALEEFGVELGRASGATQPVRIVVRARSASPNAVKALTNLGIVLEIIPP